MRDGIAVAQQGLPAVALVTTLFEPQGRFVAKASGMSTVPQVLLPHPVAGSGAEAMATLAEAIAPRLWETLQGRGQDISS